MTDRPHGKADPCYRLPMATIRPSNRSDGDRIFEIWQSAVDATHDFLKPADRIAIEKLVLGFLPTAPLWVAVDSTDRPIAFLLLVDGHMDALFVDPTWHTRGIGRALVEHALSLHPVLTTTVNEQNSSATRFYERLGFQRTGRSSLDGQGRAYPIIHLQRRR